MRKFIDSLLKSITEFFTKLSKKEKIRLAALAVAIIALSIVVAVVLSRTTYATLYSGDAETAGEIITELDSLGVTYKTPTSGTIQIPEDSVNQVKMQLAYLGYFSGGFSYEILSSVSGFGTTDYELQQYSMYQDEYNTRQQLLTIDKIKDCLVKIKIPESTSFVLSNNTEQASAAVTLELTSGATLSDSEVGAIAAVVSAGTSVPIENVFIVDTNANLYTVGGSDTSGAADLSYQLQLQNQVRTQLETQVVSLLATVFGDGRVKASVSVELSFDKETVQSVVFEPPVEGSEEGIVVSMSEVYEFARDSYASGVVGTDSNGIGTVEYPYGEDDEYYYYNIAKEINYEINETVTELEKAQATISRLSIAVLLDSEALAADYTENVRNLVVNAIGVNEDYITVERLPFQTDSDEFTSAIEAQEEIARKVRTMQLVELILKWAIILFLGLAVLAFLRTLVKALARPEPTLAFVGAAADGGMGDAIDYMADDDILSVYNEVDLNSKSEGVAQLERFIDKDSKAIAQLLRNWLTDEE